jgi:hypothetical protein
MTAPRVPTWSNQPVSGCGRLLAAFLLTLFFLALAGYAIAAILGDRISIQLSSGALLGAIYVFPFLWHMAVRGKYPTGWFPWQ